MGNQRLKDQQTDLRDLMKVIDDGQDQNAK
jgi:hypothetical protein